MLNMYVVHTSRFILRKVTENDCEDIFSILKDRETVKYLNLPSITELGDVNELIKEYLHGYQNGTKYPYVIIDKQTNRLIGVFLIKLDLYDDDCFEFTVYIGKNFWNKGVYSEVLPEMMKFAFDCIKTGNFRGFVMRSNISSAKVLLKNKFSLEKTFAVEGLPEMIESYLMTRNYYYSEYLESQ